MILSQDDIISLNASGVSWGACYNYSSSGLLGCSETINCFSGVFVAGATCKSNYHPDFNKNENDFWVSDPIVGSTISSVKIGDPLFGGIYCGIFTPSGVSFSDNVQILSSTDSTNYAMIMKEDKFAGPYIENKISTLNPNTSNYNGAYNAAFANKVKVDIETQNDFYKDWRIPSIAELYFIHYKAYKSSAIFRSIIHNLYGSNNINITSSSVFRINTKSKIQESSVLNENYLYGMDFNRGRVVLIGPYIISIFMYIRLVRLI